MVLPLLHQYALSCKRTNPAIIYAHSNIHCLQNNPAALRRLHPPQRTRLHHIQCSVYNVLLRHTLITYCRRRYYFCPKALLRRGPCSRSNKGTLPERKIAPLSAFFWSLWSATNYACHCPRGKGSDTSHVVDIVYTVA